MVTVEKMKRRIRRFIDAGQVLPVHRVRATDDPTVFTYRVKTGTPLAKFKRDKLGRLRQIN